jgi:hypothetical protein
MVTKCGAEVETAQTQWPAPTVFALYIQNSKSQGANRTFSKTYILRRITELRRKAHVYGLDKVFKWDGHRRLPSRRQALSAVVDIGLELRGLRRAAKLGKARAMPDSRPSKERIFNEQPANFGGPGKI